MNKIFFIIGYIGVSLLCGCGNSTNKNKTVVVSGSPQTEAIRANLIYPNESDTIQIELTDGKAKLEIHKKERQGILLKFNSQDNKRITGSLSSKDSTANIRFSQLVMPDGTMDGPFGRNITYDLAQKGDYLLIIHENQMAADPWEGDFVVEIHR